MRSRGKGSRIAGAGVSGRGDAVSTSLAEAAARRPRMRAAGTAIVRPSYR